MASTVKKKPASLPDPSQRSKDKLLLLEKTLKLVDKKILNLQMQMTAYLELQTTIRLKIGQMSN